MRNGINVWFDKKANRWVFQVAYKDQFGERRTIQRRAKTEREAHRRAIDLSRSPQLHQSHVRRPKFPQLIEEYASAKAKTIRDSSLANSLHILRLYALPHFKDLRVDQITGDQVLFWMDTLRQKGLRTSTINTARAKLRAILDFAEQKSYLISNPAKHVPQYKMQPGEETLVRQPWSLTETKQALQAFKGTPIEAFVVLAVSTGMRKGEILGLKWSDIDFHSGQIRVLRSRGERRVLTGESSFTVKVADGFTKTRASLRSLPLTPFLRTNLESQRQRLSNMGMPVDPTDYVITNSTGGPISPSFLAKVFKRVLRQHGLRLIRIQDLRHTSAVLALEARVPIEEVSQGLGHTGIEITKKTYAPVVPALSDRFVNRVSEVLS